MSHRMAIPSFQEKSSDWPRVGGVTMWFNQIQAGPEGGGWGSPGITMCIQAYAVFRRSCGKTGWAGELVKQVYCNNYYRALHD